MKRRLYLATVILLATTAATAQVNPGPSYNLPESGRITTFGPDGITTTMYSNHGRTFTSIGPGKTVIQRDMGEGSVQRFESRIPTPAEIKRMTEDSFGWAMDEDSD